jgi:hypothetical protein
VFTAANVAAVTLAWRWRPWRRREHASPVPERRSPVQSITALKVGYAVLVIAFTSLTVALLLYVMQPRAEGDTAGLLRLVMPFGWVGFLAAWLGWRLARSLRLSPATAAGVALGSMMGGVNLAVFAWVMTRRVPRPD